MQDYVVDMLGKKYGKLTVLSRNGSTKKWQALWLCQCECGNTTSVIGAHLRNGNTRSCGCLRKKNSTIHGMCGTKLHNTWLDMIKRTTQPSFKDWENYGGRGIICCDKWLTFTGFWEDMGPTWDETLTLDRIDVNGNYCKENCRWATGSTQNHNKRKRRECSSRFMGVAFHKSTRKWSAQICLNSKIEYLGEYLTEDVAAQVYDNRSEEIYGDRPNGTIKSGILKESLNA